MASNLPSVDPGKIVWVLKENSNISDREAGVVLQKGCQYQDEEGELQSDGIMVKLNISNVKGIFPPSLVQSYSVSPAGRPSRRSRIVSPSPTGNVLGNDKKGKTSVATKRKRGAQKEEEEGKQQNITTSEKKSKYFAKSKTSWLFDSDSAGNDEDDDDPPIAQLKKKPPSKKKAAAQDPKAHDADNDIILASDTDSDDLKDMPFRIEYATTGRATCKGCDERIKKESLRVSQRPLFRGKPGFVVYRHLHCTVFSEEIKRIQDVGGWRRIRIADRETLMDRIQESKALVEKENQELEPDELVQASFQGEIRKSPKGLAATLLPFQVEGTSWM